jgi:hypothetical protein
VVSVCDGHGCVAFAFRELLGNRSVGRVELVDAFGEYVLEVVIVVAGVGADEVDDLAVAVGGLLIVASGLVDHPEAVPSIMHIGEAFEEVARGALGFVELAGTDEVNGGVGGSVEFVAWGFRALTGNRGHQKG